MFELSWTIDHGIKSQNKHRLRNQSGGTSGSTNNYLKQQLRYILMYHQINVEQLKRLNYILIDKIKD